jgi:DedD protein
MAKVLLFLIIGLILGLGVAAAARELGYWGVPSRAGVRPNLRKGRLKFAVVPVVGAVFVSVLAWLAFGALFTPDKPSQPSAGNSVSKPIPASKPLGAPSGPSTPATRPPKAQPSPTERLVADSPVAEAALRVSPIQSALEQIGSMGARAAVPSSAATVKPTPETKPKPQKPSAETSTKPPSPAEQPKPTPTAKPAEPPKPAQVETGVAYTVHLASFTEKENADRTLAKLKAAGVSAFVSQVEINGQVWHRLMVGRFPTQQQAQAYGKQLQEKGLTADMGPFKVKPIASGG